MGTFPHANKGFFASKENAAFRRHTFGRRHTPFAVSPDCCIPSPVGPPARRTRHPKRRPKAGGQGPHRPNRRSMRRNNQGMACRHPLGLSSAIKTSATDCIQAGSHRAPFRRASDGTPSPRHSPSPGKRPGFPRRNGPRYRASGPLFLFPASVWKKAAPSHATNGYRVI